MNEITIYKKYVPKGIELIKWNQQTGETKIVFVNRETNQETVKKTYTTNFSNELKTNLVATC
jgi:hypothetical protein